MSAGKLQRNFQIQGLGLAAVPTLALVKVPMGQVVISNVQCVKSIMLHSFYLESTVVESVLVPLAPLNRSPSCSKSAGRRYSLLI